MNTSQIGYPSEPEIIKEPHCAVWVAGSKIE